MKNKKILITGATGFVGSNITRYFLKQGADIAVFALEGEDTWRIKDILNDVCEYSVDLRNEEKTKNAVLSFKPQLIFHTAIYGGHIFQKETQRIMNTNFQGTVNLLTACNNIEYELFINTGSSSEYGIKSHPLKEDDLPEPVTDYGLSKLAATLYAQLLAKRENKPIVTLRLFSPYGDYDEPTRLIPYTSISCLKDENPKVSAASCVRDFIYIKDVIDAYTQVIENKEKVKGQIINIGSGMQYSIGDVVDKIIKLTGSSVKPEWGQSPNSRLEPKIWQADISKAQKLLGWKPKYDLEKGLKMSIEWLKKNNFLFEKDTMGR
ncbi:MAG: NAD(P)-dependent oxidoreductase [Candidatus Omnitrophica bacterium]|nr:NAD(P)-dependent oxidoreductase [Candidatus Omnitrophota bacterium]MBU1924546.1 NAD(P)-dependent oxidoreductase [Candidatus Omnitrophota bacterium]